MRSQQRGFTLIELLVVIAIIAILASILFPVFAKAREKARQTTCTSQVRQLATAVQMYVQDNNSRYPGLNWSNAILNYAGSPKIYFCPSDSANDKSQPCSYGYNGLLVRPDTTGLNEAQVSAPTEVGAIADATPSRPMGELTLSTLTVGGGLVGGGALASTAQGTLAVELDPRHTGVIVGFCDGHAKFFPGKRVDLKDQASPLARAFFAASALGLVKNYGGGIEQVTLTSDSAAPAIIGGDSSTMPIVLAAADVWAGTNSSNTWFSRGFKGVNSPDRVRAIQGQFVWGDATNSGTAPAGTAYASIGQDVLAIIVSKNCKISYGGFNADNAMATSVIDDLFTTSNGFSENVFQAYTYLGTASGVEYNGNTAFFRGKMAGITIGNQAQRVTDDYEMVEKVAADPYGIGFCSAAIADPDKVKVLTITAAGTDHYYPNVNPKYRTVMPDAASDSNHPFKRTLKVQIPTAAGVGTKFAGIFADAAFQAGPLFRQSYWKP